MTDPVSEFLVTNPTTAKWLDDIIDALLHQPRGTAHVSVLAHKLWRPEKRDVDSIEQTITRRINDFCGDAADFNKSAAHDLFQRVEPATYCLRSFPEKPDIYELTTTRFDDPAMQYMWELFSTTRKKLVPEKWKAATNRRRLELFVKWMSDPDQQESYDGQKSLYRDIEGGLDF
jgi:hypothetical protein